MSGHGGATPPTLEAVAARAGVSRATASRVLRGATNVSEHARIVVLAAADQLSYSPNLAARSLVTGRSDSVAFMVAESEDLLFSDPFFLGVLRGAQTAVAAAGLQLVFTVASTPEEQRRFVNYATSGHVDGVLLMSLHGTDAVQEEVEARGVPAVLSGRPMTAGDDMFYVDADNVQGAAVATSYLIAAGRHKVGTITGPLDMCAGQDRRIGYLQALGAAGIAPDPSLCIEGNFTMAGGHAAMNDLLDAHPDVDAIFAASDLTALGAMRTIERRGLRVPHDIAVVGFDDIAEAQYSHPALSTVRQPIQHIGYTMAQLLLQRIRGEDSPLSTVLPVELVLRESA